jgi:hypothetical protein
MVCFFNIIILGADLQQLRKDIMKRLHFIIIMLVVLVEGVYAEDTLDITGYSEESLCHITLPITYPDLQVIGSDSGSEVAVSFQHSVSVIIKSEDGSSLVVTYDTPTQIPTSMESIRGIISAETPKSIGACEGSADDSFTAFLRVDPYADAANPVYHGTLAQGVMGDLQIDSIIREKANTAFSRTGLYRSHSIEFDRTLGESGNYYRLVKNTQDTQEDEIQLEPDNTVVIDPIE